MNPFNHKPGYSYKENKEIEFILWAPTQKKVDLKITFPESALYPMAVDEWGYWKVTLPHIVQGTRYVFVLEDGTVCADPASVSQPDGVFHSSEIIDKTFGWTDTQWKGLTMKELIIYELHIGTFTQEGTLQALIGKLDYLQELGISAIELMPIAQFSGNHNWGYDGVFSFAVHHSYGTAQDLKALVDKAHGKGIAVLLDVVYNHTGPEGCCFKKITPTYFIDKYKTPWGDALNFEGPYSDGVRNYFIHNALMWLDEYHIDGLRMDAVHAINDTSAMHFVEELNAHVMELEKRSGKKKILIAELDLNDTRFLRSSEKGGYGLDGQWADEFHHALHSILTDDRDGYYEDFGTMQHLENAYRNTFVYNGIYSKHRKKIFGSQPDNPYHQYVVFSQNHDHIGNRPLGDRLASTLSFEALKLAAAAVLLSPYVPLLFMGEEYAEQNPFLYFVDYKDEDLGKNVSEGRKKEFSCWDLKEFIDPLLKDTFNKSKLSWAHESPEGSVMLAYYKYLIQFRKNNSVMLATERSDMTVHPSNGAILAIERFTDNERLLIIMNFGKQKQSYLNNTISDYRMLLDSSDKEWGGINQIIFGELRKNESAEINPLSVRLYQSI